jgi:hypothetical protein
MSILLSWWESGRKTKKSRWGKRKIEKKFKMLFGKLIILYLSSCSKKTIEPIADVKFFIFVREWKEKKNEPIK